MKGAIMKHTDRRTRAATAPVVCDKCGTKAMGYHGMRHRRCSGQGDQGPRNRDAKRLAHADRGTWQAT